MSPGWIAVLVAVAAFYMWRGYVRHQRDVTARAIREAPVELFADGLALLVEIQYQDTKGERSLRQVTIERVLGIRPAGMPPLATAIEGKCHLRNSRRSFKVAQVLALADPRTGEVAADPGAWLLKAAADPETPKAPVRGHRNKAAP